MALAEGLIANLPKIIDVAVQIILTLVDFIVANLPAIIAVAIQIIMALINGLIQAIPALAAAIPQIVMAIIEGLLSINWLQVGLDIIGGIGKGLVNGLKFIFSGGKKAGKEVGAGLSEGFAANAFKPKETAISTADTITAGLKPDTAMVNSYGANTMTNYGTGLKSTAPASATIATSTASVVKNNLAVDASSSGQKTGSSYSIGLNSISGSTIGTAAQLASDVKDAGKTDIPVQVVPDIKSFSDVQAVSTKTSKDCVTAFDTSFKEIIALVTKSMKDVVTIIAKTSLFDTGKNVMQGLNDGMLSMEATIIKTARRIANAVPNTANTSLEVQSPSRVMFKTGAFAAEGQRLGMLSKLSDIKSAAVQVGENSVPIKQQPSRYTPENSPISRSTATNETNNFNPQFTANFQGGGNDRDTQRQIKSWIFQYLDEYFESMGRRNPQITEV